MNKFLIISIILLVIGLFFFGFAGYCYWTIRDMQETFAYYGIGENTYLSNAKTAPTFLNLKFGIVKFSILGLVSWVLAVVFFIKRKSNIASL